MKRVVITLGTTQTVAWASSYYLPAILAMPMARDLGVEPTSVFAAFSAALLISAALGPRVGRTIDAFGGREVLAISNLVLGLGLIMLATAQGSVMLWSAWLMLGIGMSLGLYDAGFATLGRIYGEGARPAITGITLIAGFASTVGWPLSAWGLAEIGWRNTCLGWAAVNLLLALPLNRFVLPAITRGPGEQRATPDKVVMDRNMWVLAFAFSAAWMVTAALAVHLPGILMAAGATATQAVAAGALVGPAQVGARMLEASVFRRIHPLTSLRGSLLAHPLGVAAFALSGGTLSAVMVILHGAGNGVMTIARGTVPLSVFGAENYGLRLGLLGAPARVSQAFAPLLFGIALAHMGAGVLMITSALMLTALGSLWLVRALPQG